MADVQDLAQALLGRGWMLATAESCTGGLVAAECTSLAGSSDWFERGFVTYSNEAKIELLGVEPAQLEHHGAVSAETVRAMARGALDRSRADIAIAITGIAGPSGAVPGKPVGTVWLGWCIRGEQPGAHLLKLSGDRAEIRRKSVDAAVAKAAALAAAGSSPGARAS
jgi:nicotinamide-nucleotide amidase